MGFKEFCNSIKIINDEKKIVLREKFIDSFIDTNDEYYLELIEKRITYSDGLCYSGYLWDCLINVEVIDESYIQVLSGGFNSVYAMWDMHSCEKINIPNYWRFAKDDIIEGSFEDILKGEKYLPEDVYFFDESMMWCLVKTHEDIYGKRYCLKSGCV